VKFLVAGSILVTVRSQIKNPCTIYNILLSSNLCCCFLILCFICIFLLIILYISLLGMHSQLDLYMADIITAKTQLRIFH